MRCIAIQSKMTSYLWNDFVGTACCIPNKSPSEAIGSKIPEELWIGKDAKKLPYAPDCC